MTRLAQAWCPTCREWTVLDPGRPCAWCDTQLVAKRGGWKRPDRAATSLISRAQARALHAKHHEGTSIRELGRLTYRTLGYASPRSCALGILAALDREGLRVRDQATATAAANRARTVKETTA